MRPLSLKSVLISHLHLCLASGILFMSLAKILFALVISYIALNLNFIFILKKGLSFLFKKAQRTDNICDKIRMSLVSTCVVRSNFRHNKYLSR